jgi:hypothetical protein
MSIREVTRTTAAQQTLKDRITEILITDDGIRVTWTVGRESGESRTAYIMASGALWALVQQRTSFRNLLDELRDDTHASAV